MAPRQAMPGMRHAIGGRRSFVKDKPRVSVPLFERQLVDAPLAPEAADLRFELGEVYTSGDRFEHEGRKALGTAMANDQVYQHVLRATTQYLMQGISLGNRRLQMAQPAGL